MTAALQLASGSRAISQRWTRSAVGARLMMHAERHPTAMRAECCLAPRQDKQAAQWSLCSALISQRLQSRQWKDIVLAKPSVERASQILAGEGEGDGVAGAVPRASFDPQVETRLLGASLTQKAFDSAVPPRPAPASQQPHYI
jgi:hypothetical protein